MLESDIVTLTNQALVVGTRVVAPLLIVSLVVGLVVSLLQAVFQVQDQVLAMVPRLAACGLLLVLTSSWMLRELVDYTGALFASIPDLVR